MAYSAFSASTGSPLPVRPARHNDEWIETYLVRIARANGLRFPLARDIELLRNNTLIGNHDPNDGTGRYLNELPLWARRKRGSPVRYCPACFQEGRYARTRWRIRTFEMCTLHSMHLKWGLVEPSLSEEANYPKAIRLTEATDEQLWEGATCPLPDERRLALDTWAAFERNVMDADPVRLRESLAWALLVEQLLDAVASTGEGPEVPLRGTSKLAHRATWLRQTGLSIAASNDGIIRFLTSIKKHSERRAAVGCLTGRGRSYAGLFNSDLFHPLPFEDLHARLVAVAPETYCPVSNGALPVSYVRDGYVSIYYAEGLLSQGTAFVHHLMRARFFKDVQKVQFGRRTYYFIAREELENCRRWLSECMTPPQLLRHLQIDRATYRTLRKWGLLRFFKIGVWVFHRVVDIASLMTKLEGAARLLNQPDKNLLPLFGSWLLEANRCPQAFAVVFDELMQGRLALFRDSHLSGLPAYYVNAATCMRAWEVAAGLHKASRRSQVDQLELFEPEC